MMSRPSSMLPTTDLRILLIEPDEDTRHLLELALSARGHRVTAGADAEDAWRALEQAAFPFIVINRRLPDIDGLRLCRQVRSLPSGETSTIVIIAEDADPAERADALEAGASDYLAWPADAIALRAHLEAAERMHHGAGEPSAVEAPVVKAEPEPAPVTDDSEYLESEIALEVEEVALSEEFAEPTTEFVGEYTETEQVVAESFGEAGPEVAEASAEESAESRGGEPPVEYAGERSAEPVGKAPEGVAEEAEPPAEEASLGDDVLFVIAPDGTVRSMTALAAELLGYDPDAVVGTNAFALFHPDDAPRLLSMLTRAFTAAEPEAAELRLRVDDDWPSAPIYLTNRLTDPDVQGFVIHVVLPEPEPEPEPEPDVEAQGVTDLPGFDLLYDALTHLPTFPLYLDRLEHALARASRRGEPVVTMLLEMSGFEPVAEQYGDGAVDQLVVAIGQRIQSCLRAGDTVARVAPNEFAIIVEGIIGVGDASLVAKRLIADLEEPYVVDGAEVRLHPALGIAVSVQDRYSARDMLRHARVAREYVREHAQDGRRYALYESVMEYPQAASETPEIILDEEPAGEPVAEAGAAPAAEPTMEAWFMPLIERITSLEREISRLASEHAALKAEQEDAE